MALAILDTSVYLEHFRKGLYRKELQAGDFLIRNSAVVLAELYRGCRLKEERESIDELASGFPVIVPTEKIWVESGKILSRFSEKKGYSPDKLRNLHFDVLIALSARSIGAWVITLDGTDFEEIRKARSFKLILWSR